MRIKLFLTILIFGLFISCATIPKPDSDPIPDGLPIPDPDFSLGVILIGDTGTGTPEQYQVAAMMEEYCKKNKCDLALLLGDNIYQKGVKTVDDPQFQEKFEKPYKNLKFPFRPALGNHDAYGCWICQVGYSKHSEKWDMPAQYYTFKYGEEVEFFAIDSNWDYFRKPLKKHEQHKWLEEKLENSKAKWKIVYGHHPVYSGGSHADDMWMKFYLKPKLERYDVDFYVAGHDHDKQLIHKKSGVKYIVSGAGAKLRTTRSSDDHLFAKSSLGFAHMLFSKTDMRLQFVGAKGEIEYEKIYKK